MSKSLLVLAVAVVATAACREGLAPGGGVMIAPAPQQLVVQLVVESTGEPGEYLLRAVSRAGAGMPRPSAFQASLRLPTGVVVLSDATAGSGALAASRFEGNELRVAGATAEAAGLTDLFTVRVRAPSVETLDDASIALTEAVDGSGRDLRGALRIVARPARQLGVAP